jgi:hypothetical protein
MVEEHHVVVYKTRKRTSHGFHLTMSLITLGAWVPIWILVTMWNAWGPRAKTVVRETVTR